MDQDMDRDMNWDMNRDMNRDMNWDINRGMNRDIIQDMNQGMNRDMNLTKKLDIDMGRFPHDKNSHVIGPFFEIFVGSLWPNRINYDTLLLLLRNYVL